MSPALWALAVRVLGAVSPGVVHPDEMFQGPEPGAAVVFGAAAHVPWELADCATPYRSIVPPCVRCR